MVQRVYGSLREVIPQARLTVAVSESQLPAIHQQLGPEVGVCVEPCRRDTFPAIALAAAHLHDVQGVDEREPVVVCPVDPWVDEAYFCALKRLAALVEADCAQLMLMGIEPTYPSEKYGYIIPHDAQPVSRVRTFREKPTQAVAREYIADGALWNGGVFGFRLGYMLQRTRTLTGHTSYRQLLDGYAQLRRISFDYAVVEQEAHIGCMRFEGLWKDLGTWNTLTEAMHQPLVGNVVADDHCQGLHVINETSVPVLCMGLKDVAVAVTERGIIITDKERSGYIKPYVEQITNNEKK